MTIFCEGRFKYGLSSDVYIQRKTEALDAIAIIIPIRADIVVFPML